MDVTTTHHGHLRNLRAGQISRTANGNQRIAFPVLSFSPLTCWCAPVIRVLTVCDRGPMLGLFAFSAE